VMKPANEVSRKMKGGRRGSSIAAKMAYKKGSKQRKRY